VKREFSNSRFQTQIIQVDEREKAEGGVGGAEPDRREKSYLKNRD